jgi:parallel beta-helix repeat protein
MTTYYVDNTPFSGHHTGKATGGGANTITLEASCAEANDAFNNYGIYIYDGTGSLKTGRRITDYDSASRVATVNANWDTAPDNTSYYDITYGCDVNDGKPTSYSSPLYDGSHGAFASISAATTAAALTGGDTIYVKAGTEYSWMYSSTAKYGAYLTKYGSTTARITLAGYKTTPGDADSHPGDESYMAVIKGNRVPAVQMATGINPAAATAVYYNVFNFKVYSCSTYGLSIGAGGSYIHVKNCKFEQISAHEAVRLGTGSVVQGCIFDQNYWGIYLGGADNLITECIFDSNTHSGIYVNNVNGNVISRCLFYGMPASYAGIESVTSGTIQAHNCVFDGEDIGANYGIKSVYPKTFAVNCIATRCGTGLYGPATYSPITSWNNVLYDNSADTSQWPAGVGHITSDPQFTNIATHDYTIPFASPARGAGYPLYLDIGAYQREETAAPTPIFVIDD